MGTTKNILGALAVMSLLAACAKQESATVGAVDSPEVLAERAAAAEREAEIQKREADLAAREADLAQAQADAAKPVSRPASKPVSKPPAAVPVVSKPSSSKPVPAAPRVLVVPAGTQLPLALTEAISTKSAKVGDTVRAGLTSDVRVSDRVAIPSGTTVAGTVTTVVSGSDKIGGVPKLVLHFDRLELPGGKDVPINGEIIQTGKSDTGGDTAKIVGGTAAGAIIGGQVKGGDKGKVIGGLIGGAIGAVAAHETGTEAKLAAGSPLVISLASAIDIPQTY